MRRREFITLLGSAAAAWPLAAGAQQLKRRIGVLMSLVENDPEGQARIRALLDGLQQLGWTDGRKNSARLANAAMTNELFAVRQLTVAK